MKIYIKNYSCNKIFEKRQLLHEFLIEKKEIIEIFSNEGLFYIDENNVYKVTYLDKPVFKIDNFIEQIDIIIDPTIIETEINSSIPANHYSIKTEVYKYQLNNTSKIKFVIIISQDDNMIVDYYFVVPDDTDINSKFFKEDINVFLFHLK
jgi:hypothetical protein